MTASDSVAIIMVTVVFATVGALVARRIVLLPNHGIRLSFTALFSTVVDVAFLLTYM